MTKARPVTYDTVRRIALALPGVEEGTSYGTAALKARGKLFIRLKEDGQTVVFKTTFPQRDQLLAEAPGIYFITDHYREYEWVLVRLSAIGEDALRDMVRTAHRLATAKARKTPR